MKVNVSLKTDIKMSSKCCWVPMLHIFTLHRRATCIFATT